MKFITIKILSIVFVISLLLSSCRKFEPGEGNEEEVITTMNLYFSPSIGGSPIVYSFDDPDGPGGNPPVQSEIVLAANTSYDVKIELLNKTVTPADSITNEVAEEAEAHRFYYTTSTGTNISVTAADLDGNGVPLGIFSHWMTGPPSNGSVKITLRHYPGTPPDKNAADPVSSPKSTTDIDISFTTKVM